MIFFNRSILSSLEVLPKVLKASDAAWTAKSISPLVPAETCPITSSVAGFSTSILSSDSDSTH